MPSYRAHWVIPVTRPPLQHATLVVEDGRIVDLHDRADPKAEDLGNVAILPGLVNAHTHLEFSTLTEPLPMDGGFPAWIQQVVAQRRAQQGSRAIALQEGLRESAEAGTCLLGEIATADETPGPDAPLASASGENAPADGPRVDCVVFRELLGFSRDGVAEQLATAHRHLNRTTAASPLPRGLSPHAPYSVHPDLFTGVIQLAAAQQVPVAMHLAETRAELELLSHGTGELAEMLRELGVWKADLFPSALRTLDFLRGLAEAPHGLVVHGNYLRPEDVEFLCGAPHLTVVYCPRTHAAFGHEPHSWRGLVQRGVRVALGTDSRASNPDLSLWNELRFLQTQNPDLPPQLLLRMGTLSGAEALGLADEYGSLEPGKRAQLLIRPLPANCSDPYAGLFR